MTVSLDDFSVDVPVTIEKTPIKSIEANPISLIENTNGYLTNEYDEDTDEEIEYYYYSPDSLIEGTVELESGETISFYEGEFNYNDNYYWFYHTSNQSSKNQWTAGNTYTITASLMGVSVEIPVTITKNPFKTVTIEPVTIIENTSGYIASDYDSETDEMYDYYHYSPSGLMKYTIELTNGSTISEVGNGFEYNGKMFYFETETDQSYLNQWAVGNTYTMNATLLNFSVDVPVIIKKSPLKNLTIEPIRMIEGTGGYLEYEDEDEENSYYYYSPEELIKFTLEWEDGFVTTGTGNMFDYDNQTYWFDTSADQSYTNPWTAGNTYTMLVSVMGVDVAVPVTIIKDIESDGDVDGDGSVSVMDATAIQKYLVSQTTFSDEQFSIADVTGDGKVSVLDATQIQKQLVGL